MHYISKPLLWLMQKLSRELGQRHPNKLNIFYVHDIGPFQYFLDTFQYFTQENLWIFLRPSGLYLNLTVSFSLEIINSFLFGHSGTGHIDHYFSLRPNTKPLACLQKLSDGV